MAGNRKKFVWIIGGIGIFLVLLLGLLLLAPRLINLEPIREKIVSRIAQLAGGAVELKEIDFSLFPRPRVVMHEAALTVPGKIIATIKTATVYPALFPLLKGKIRLAKLELASPVFRVPLAQETGTKADGPKRDLLKTFEEKAALMLAPLALNAPDLTAVVEKGSLDLTQGNQPLFSFQNIDARILFPPERMEIDVTCNSNLWEKLSVEADLDAEDFKGNGSIDLKGFQPQTLTNYLIPEAPYSLGESSVGITVNYEMDSLTNLQAEVQGSIPLLTLNKGKEKLVIQGKSVEGEFHRDKDRVSMTVTELTLYSPKLNATGKFLLDQTASTASMEVEGRDVDVESIRQTALAALGEFSVTREIFDIVKGGEVPLITFSSHGKSLADLGELENIVIKGNMSQGKIFVPGVELDLDEVKGEVVISKGILEGENLEARHGDTLGSQGALRLGLEGEGAPFHLDITLQADLAQLPPILKRVVNHEVFLKELSLIDRVKGSAEGRLVLGESLDAIKTHVDVSSFDLSAASRRLPYPLELKGGHLIYDDTRIHVENVNGKLSRSSFAGLSGHVDWQKAPYLEIRSGKMELSSDEIYPWLISYEKMRGRLKTLPDLKGSVALTSLSLKGPILKPEKWLFETTGDVKKLMVNTTLFPEPIQVKRGNFHVIEKPNHQRLSFKNTQMNTLDASLHGSGVLHNYMIGLNKFEMNLQGEMGPKAIRWMSDLVKLPTELDLHAPLSIAEAHLVCDRGSQTLFQGKLTVKNGPSVTMDILKKPGELAINKVLVEDQESNASLALHLEEREFRFTFQGSLSAATTEKLLVESPFTTGWVKGDFQTHVFLDQPARSTAQGRLMGEDILLPIAQVIPLQIKNVSLDAATDQIKVDPLAFTWGDKQLSLTGGISFSEQGFLLDMDLSSDGIEWKSIEDALEKWREKRDVHEKDPSRKLPLRGIVRFKSDYFKHDRFMWKPFHGDISFTQEETKITVSDAVLCGIATPGIVEVFPEEVRLDFKPLSSDQELAPAVDCLWGKEGIVSGRFNLEGDVTARGIEKGLLQSLGGNLEFFAHGGRIYRFNLLSKILSLLNVTEIYRGKFPSLVKEGVQYDSIRVVGELREGKLVLKEAVLDGSSIEIVLQGDLNLMDNTIDLKGLVVPSRALGRIFQRIPLVRKKLVSIPISAKGKFTDPEVDYLSAKSVGSELMNIIKKTVQYPVDIVSPKSSEKSTE